MHNAAQSVSANLSNGGIPTGSMQTVPANTANNSFLNERQRLDWRRELNQSRGQLIKELVINPALAERLPFVAHQVEIRRSNYQTHLKLEVRTFYSVSEDFLGVNLKICLRCGGFPPLVDVTIWRTEAAKDMVDNTMTDLRTGSVNNDDYHWVRGVLYGLGIR